MTMSMVPLTCRHAQCHVFLTTCTSVVCLRWLHCAAKAFACCFLYIVCTPGTEHYVTKVPPSYAAQEDRMDMCYVQPQHTPSLPGGEGMCMNCNAVHIHTCCQAHVHDGPQKAWWYMMVHRRLGVSVAAFTVCSNITGVSKQLELL